MADARIELLTPDQVTEFRQTLLANARSLYDDAHLLLESKRYARTHSLALLAFEELAKLQPVWGVSADPARLSSDWKYIKQFMTKHPDKIAIALFTEHLLAAVFGIDHPPDSIFKGYISTDDLEKEARRLNLLKQDGFYVGFDGKQLLSPEDVIDESMARAVVGRLRVMLAMFSAFDWLCSLPGQPTREQILEAKSAAQAGAI